MLDSSKGKKCIIPEFFFKFLKSIYRPQIIKLEISVELQQKKMPGLYAGFFMGGGAYF